jgi:predicted transcriptional regulator
MEKPLKRAASRTEILEAISDAKSLELLSLIAKGQGSKTKDLIAQVGISRREYYGRMSKFLNTDLIVRRHGKWHLSKFGLVIYGVVTILVKEINVTELTR